MIAKNINSKIIQFIGNVKKITEIKKEVSRISGVYHVSMIFETNELIIFMNSEQECQVLAQIQHIKNLKTH